MTTVFKFNKVFISIRMSKKSGVKSKDQTKEYTEQKKELREILKTENVSIS